MRGRYLLYWPIRSLSPWPRPPWRAARRGSPPSAGRPGPSPEASRCPPSSRCKCLVLTVLYYGLFLFYLFSLFAGLSRNWTLLAWDKMTHGGYISRKEWREGMFSALENKKPISVKHKNRTVVHTVRTRSVLFTARDLPSMKNLVAPPWKSSPGLLRLMSRVWVDVYRCLTLSGCFTTTLSAWS